MSEPNPSSTEQLPPPPDSEAVLLEQPIVQPQEGADYLQLVRFLVCPFLDSPELLKVDCEVSPRTMRVLVRIAFEGDDQGRVFGRGGRNLQAVRTVLQAVACAFGHSAHLEVFGNPTGNQAGNQAGGAESEAEHSPRPAAPRRPPQLRVTPQVNP